MSVKIDYEGTRRLKTVFQPSENKVYVQQDSEQIERDIYSRNKRARQADQTGKGPVRMHLQMSEQDYVQLCQQYPELHHGSTSVRRKLWQKIAKERPELVAMEFKPRLHRGGT